MEAIYLSLLVFHKKALLMSVGKAFLLFGYQALKHAFQIEYFFYSS